MPEMYKYILLHLMACKSTQTESDRETRQRAKDRDCKKFRTGLEIVVMVAETNKNVELENCIT